MLSFSLLLLPRLGLWSRDKAAKGTAVVAIGVVGRIDAAIIKVEVVGVASIRVGSRGPINTVLASEVELISIVRIDTAAPHKDEGTKPITKTPLSLNKTHYHNSYIFTLAFPL